MAALGNESQNGTLVGCAASLLSNSSKTTGAEHVYGLFEFAFSLNQSLLAFHHASAGHLAEFLNECCGDFCHGNSFQIEPSPTRRAREKLQWIRLVLIQQGLPLQQLQLRALRSCPQR